MQRITIEYWDDLHDLERKHIFTGRWLIDPVYKTESNDDRGYLYGVAETEEKNYVFYYFQKNPDEMDGIFIYDTLEDAMEMFPKDIVELAISRK